MELLYVKEHLTCYNYDGDGRPAVEVTKLAQGQAIVSDIVEPEILLVLEGSIGVSFEQIRDGAMSAGGMVLLPPCSSVTIVAKGAAEIIRFRLRTDVRLCDRYSLEKLYDEVGRDCKEFEGRLNTLTANEKVRAFVELFRGCIDDGLKCIYFFEIKIKEMFFILRAYYTKEELAAFFASMLCADSGFLYFVLDNYSKVHSVKDFAQLAGYSLSGFDKQFRKVFGMSAYQWMTQKRLKSIYHDIHCSSKTLREICEEHDFSSLSQFNDYCKKHFGLPPGKIRRQLGCDSPLCDGNVPD